MTTDIHVGYVSAKDSLNDPDRREEVRWQWEDSMSAPAESLRQAFARAITRLVDRGLMPEDELEPALEEMAQFIEPLEARMVAVVKLGTMFAQLEALAEARRAAEDSLLDQWAAQIPPGIWDDEIPN